MGDRPIFASVKLERVKCGRSANICERVIRANKIWAIDQYLRMLESSKRAFGRSALALLFEQVGIRQAGTCDVNRASGRSVGRHLRCESSKRAFGRPALAMSIEQAGVRQAGTCDGNRASRRSANTFGRIFPTLLMKTPR